eukprot:362573-Chlamydomonas_euryale.AAC.4
MGKGKRAGSLAGLNPRQPQAVLVPVLSVSGSSWERSTLQGPSWEAEDPHRRSRPTCADKKIVVMESEEACP